MLERLKHWYGCKGSSVFNLILVDYCRIGIRHIHLCFDLVTLSIISAGYVDRVSILIKVANSLENESSVNSGNRGDVTELGC